MSPLSRAPFWATPPGETGRVQLHYKVLHKLCIRYIDFMYDVTKILHKRNYKKKF